VRARLLGSNRSPFVGPKPAEPEFPLAKLWDYFCPNSLVLDEIFDGYSFFFERALQIERKGATMKGDNATPLNPGNALPMMIHVTAPATLPAGYTFETAINGDEAKLVNIEVVSLSCTRCECASTMILPDFSISLKEESRKGKFSLFRSLKTTVAFD
jgi:hypothetical protein